MTVRQRQRRRRPPRPTTSSITTSTTRITITSNSLSSSRASRRSAASPGSASTRHRTNQNPWALKAWKSSARTSASSPRTSWCSCSLTKWALARWASSASTSGWRDSPAYNAIRSPSCRRGWTILGISWTIPTPSREYTDTLTTLLGSVELDNVFLLFCCLTNFFMP